MPRPSKRFHQNASLWSTQHDKLVYFTHVTVVRFTSLISNPGLTIWTSRWNHRKGPRCPHYLINSKTPPKINRLRSMKLYANHELQRTRKQAIFSCFKSLCLSLPGWNEENYKISKLTVSSTKQDYKPLKHAVRRCGPPLFPTDRDLNTKLPAVNV